MMLVVYMCVLSAYMCAHARENHNRDHIVIIDIIKGQVFYAIIIEGASLCSHW